MSIFNKSKSGAFMDQIRCDEQSYLIWKWHPEGSELNNNTRENAVRWGSSLRVKDGELAVFVYKQADGTMQDFIEGPFDESIKTKNFPVLASIVGSLYDEGTPFQAEIYFINLAKIVQTKFAVPFFDVYDDRFADIGVPIAVRGVMSFSISDYREFIKLHRLNTFELEDFQKEIKSAVNRYIKDVIMNVPAEHGISVLQIERKLNEINYIVEQDVSERLKRDFGVTVSGVDISAIEVDKSSSEYADLLAVTKQVEVDVAIAEKSAKVKDISDKQRINVEDYAEKLRIEREEGQYATHKQTQSENMGAFQVEKQAEVGIAGAEALGKMGENGAGNIGFGGGNAGGGDGLNMAAVMTSMAVGGAVGQNIAGTMNDMMSGNNKQVGSVTPPPIPTSMYYVAYEGKPIGPYDIAGLKNMKMSNKFSSSSLVWKEGMPDWVQADSVDELKPLFAVDMPPIPDGK